MSKTIYFTAAMDNHVLLVSDSTRNHCSSYKRIKKWAPEFAGEVYSGLITIIVKTYFPNAFESDLNMNKLLFL